MPIVMLQNLTRLGGINLGLPDLSHLQIDHIAGDYTFTHGTMKIDTFQIVGPQVTIGAMGSIQLAPGTLSAYDDLKDAGIANDGSARCQNACFRNLSQPQNRSQLTKETSVQGHGD